MNNPVILASASPRRRSLLEYILPDFTVMPSHADESFPADMPVQQVAAMLAQRKAESIAGEGVCGLIIAADTVVIAGDSILNKPAHESDAVSMLMSLSGRSHDVITGVSLLDTGKKRSKKRTISVRTRVTFSAFPEADAWEYAKTGSPLDKAGAYGIQDAWTARQVRSISGDYYNVVGFPVSAVYRVLNRSFKAYLP
jgi:septum formation protein